MEAEELGALFDAWADRLLAYMTTITRDRLKAEDALQNLFLKLSAARPELRDPAVYLFRAARHEAVRVCRRRAERPLADLDLLHGRDERFEAIDIAEAVDRLPLDQQDVVVLHAFEGLSFRETAEILGIPLDTAASRYRYALEKLRTLLEP